MQPISDVQSFEHATMTLSLCLLYFQQDKLVIDTAVTQALSVVNISNGIQELSPKDSTLMTITKNLKKVSHLYISKPQEELLDTPVNDSLFQIRYNLRITINYIMSNYV